ncbi:MAG: amidohydrolase [Crocinitomicaceae bacterium]|nr:amidohydrolase [Crocinitomicaceae bacterium]|tara:strand:- start:826 stop:1602 length:777 start_codon:yes stop_codon:yes gene_type:complete
MPDIVVSIVQMNIAWQKPSNNRRKIEKLLNGSKPADLIVLPEMFTTGFTMDVQSQAEKMEGETMEWMKRLSVESRSVITGSLIIEENGRYYNRLIWMRPDGTYKHYDKRHLFRMAGEDEHFSEGQRKIFPVLKGWRICPLICYDLRFPVWSRNQNDYDLLIYVANWPEARRSAWKTLSQARAMENYSPVVAVNRIGRDGQGRTYSGDSAVYDAKGELLSRMEDNVEGVETVKLSIKDLKSYREKFPAYLDADSFAIQE